MIAQVATTPSLIGTGPTWKSVTLESGDFMASTSDTRRMTADRAIRMPSAITSSGSAPSRLARVRKPPSKVKRAEHQGRLVATRPPEANRRAFHHRLRK